MTCRYHRRDSEELSTPTVIVVLGSKKKMCDCWYSYVIQKLLLLEQKYLMLLDVLENALKKLILAIVSNVNLQEHTID